ncbi:MAG: ctpA [Candidatus Berkelbacteria bacterium]|nr:ctpA [Candidatus Berkelbacteria bacterium]
MKPFKGFLKVIGILWVAVIFYFLGYLVGNKNLTFNENFKPQVVKTDLGKPQDVDFSMFWDAWNIVTDKFVGKINTQKMVYGAIKGMVESLGDPYTSFMEANDSKMLQEDLSGQIQGIGAEITEKDGKILVVAPLADSPAERAGLKPKDEILRIDKETTSNMSLNVAISKIRGKAGTEVNLLVNRADFQKPQEFKIKREKIIIKSVKYEMKDNIGYINITQFGDDTTDLAKTAASEIKKQNPKAIVLDLRDNPGGYLDSAVDVASLFMKRGVVVKEQNKDGKIEELKTTLEGILSGYRIVILANEGSASASEIVAGALRDSRGSLIVGKRTFGKGSVQEVENLKDGNTLKVTVARWLTPSGKAIDKEGITPDVEVDLTTEDNVAGRDPQLDRALLEAGK